MKIVLSNGGTIVQNPLDATTRLVIADRKNVRVGNIIKRGQFDIVYSRYLLDCVKHSRQLQLDPRYLLFCKDETRKEFISKGISDEFDDSYKAAHSPGSLKEV